MAFAYKFAMGERAMGEVKIPKLVKPFVAVLISQPSLLPRVYESLKEKLGDTDLSSRLIDFTFSDYYEPEMGQGLKRQFLGFRSLVAPDELPELKLFTNKLEKDFAEGDKRRVNLDPGYLALPSVVLASTKDFAHRLYLQKGIYGETTLLFRQGKFSHLPWTYPDYQSDFAHQFFFEMRKRYSTQLKTAI